MKSSMLLAIVVLIGMPVAGLAQSPPQQLSCIKDITFSHEFLAKYPNAPAACQEVVEANGQKWARFSAKTEKVKNGQATFAFSDTYGNSITHLTFSFTPDAQVTVDGQPTLASNLRKGDEVTFWVPENRFGFYAQAGATTENSQFRLVSSESATGKKR
jgi:hypothetical protein